MPCEAKFRAPTELFRRFPGEFRGRKPLLRTPVIGLNLPAPQDLWRLLSIHLATHRPLREEGLVLTLVVPAEGGLVCRAAVGCVRHTGAGEHHHGD